MRRREDEFMKRSARQLALHVEEFNDHGSRVDACDCAGCVEALASTRGTCGICGGLIGYRGTFFKIREAAYDPWMYVHLACSPGPGREEILEALGSVEKQGSLF
jgi:hypothetical protein